MSETETQKIMHPYAMEIIGIPSTQYVHPYYFGTPQMKEIERN